MLRQKHGSRPWVNGVHAMFWRMNEKLRSVKPFLVPKYEEVSLQKQTQLIGELMQIHVVMAVSVMGPSLSLFICLIQGDCYCLSQSKASFNAVISFRVLGKKYSNFSLFSYSFALKMISTLMLLLLPISLLFLFQFFIC